MPYEAAWIVLIRRSSVALATACDKAGRLRHASKPDAETPGTRAMLAIGSSAWCALKTLKVRSGSHPARIRPPHLPGCRSPSAGAGLHARASRAPLAPDS